MVRVFLMCLVICSTGGLAAHAQFSGMLSRVPKDANTAVFINVEKLLGSPVAERERWRARSEAAFAAGVSAVPPTASEVVLAGRIDVEYGKSIWELALVKLSEDVNVARVAQRFGGSVDTIEGRSAAKLPNDSYVLKMSDSLAASYTPANRQDVVRWIRSTDLNDVSERYSDYLIQAHQYVTEVGSPVIMALDLGGAVSARTLAERLPSFASFADSGVDAAAAAKVIAGVRGVTLGVTFTDQANGAIRVDFSQSPTPIAKFAKPMLVEVLERQGSMIEDVRDWKPSIQGNTFLLSGTLSTEGLRRVMSVLQLPTSLATAADKIALSDDGGDESAKRLASQQYFSSVTSLLDDLRAKPKRDGVQTFGQAAAWYGKYVRKIDNLPILNVDPKLVEYGAATAQMLRNAEMSMKGVGMRSAARTTGDNSGYGYYDGRGYGGYRSGYGYGYGYGDNVYTPNAYMGTSVAGNFNAARASIQAEQRADTQIRTQERISGAASVQQIWQIIDQATSAVRREMTQQYDAEF